MKDTFQLPESISDRAGMIILEQKIHSISFTPKELGLTPRMLTNWKEKGIFPDDDISRKWVRLNFFEYLWLSIVKDLRKMECPLSVIKEAKDILFAPQLGREIEMTPEMITKVREVMKSQGCSDEEITTCITSLTSKDSVLLTQIEQFSSVFCYLIFATLIEKKNNAIYIGFDGSTIPILEDDLIAHPEMNSLFKKPHIYLPISYYLLNFISEQDKGKFLIDTNILTSDEVDVIRLIREKDFKEIIVKPIKGKTPDKDTFDTITVKDGELTPTQQQQITEILGLHNYQSITLKKRSNTQIYFERQHRR